MTRFLSLLLLLIFGVGPFAYAAPITDADNPHNMSSASAAGSVRAQAPSAGGTDQICIFCHTPHSAKPQTPLWSRPDPTGPYGDGTFPVYAQPLGIKTDTVLTGYDPANPEYPGGASRLCLSCHDGVTSIGVLLGREPITMESGSETITNLSAIIDLATSHPISFNYNQNVIDTLLGTANYQLPDGTVDMPLAGGKMECTTCHDPHEDTMATYGLPFWRHQGSVFVSRYDDVCNSCHKSVTTGSGPVHDIANP